MRGKTGCEHDGAYHGVDERGHHLVSERSKDPVTKIPIKLSIGNINLQFLDGAWTEAGGSDMSVQQEIEILKMELKKLNAENEALQNRQDVLMDMAAQAHLDLERYQFMKE